MTTAVANKSPNRVRRTTSPATSARATEILERMANAELQVEEGKRGRVRAEVWAQLQELLAGSKGQLDPLQRAWRERRKIYEAAQAEANIARDALAAVAAELGEAHASFESRETMLRNHLAANCPAELDALARALVRK